MAAPFLLLTHLSQTPFLTLKPSSLSEAVTEARKYFHLPADIEIRLLMSVDGVKVALTEGVWGRLEELSEGRRIELEVKEVEMKEGNKDKTLGVSRQISEGEDVDDFESSSDITAPLLSPGGLQSEVENNTRLVTPSKNTNKASNSPPLPQGDSTPPDPDSLALTLFSATRQEDFGPDGLKLRFSFRCKIDMITVFCDPSLVTLDTIHQAIHHRITSHNSTACASNGMYCSKEFEVKCLLQKMERSGISLKEWIERTRGFVWCAPYLQPKRIKVEGLAIDVSYS